MEDSTSHMSAPKVSVILPVYNPGPGIHKCIESLRAQLLDGMEFIFVDDCSTDASMAAVEAWAAGDDRVRIIRNELNLGAGPSRNRGIEAARGDYLSFVDPDDYVSPDFYELLYAAATAGGGHDIAKGRCCLVEGETGVIGKPENRQNEDIRAHLCEQSPLYLWFLNEHWTALWKRSLFDNPRVRYGTSVTAQDTTFQLTACYQTNDIVFEDDALYYYVKRTGSATHRGVETRTFGEADSLDEKLSFLLSEGMGPNEAEYLRKRIEIFLRRFQVALGEGLIGRDDIPRVASRIRELLSRVLDSAPQAREWAAIEAVRQKLSRISPWSPAPGEGDVRISVILPVYNPGPGIAKCIESLRAQLLDGLEFIFVDDCSTDGSMEAVEAWAAEDERVRVLRNEVNLGAGPSRNRGIEAARGDYLSFVDPDDYVSPDFYELLYAAATAGGGHDIAKGIRETVEMDGRRLRARSVKANERIKGALQEGAPLYTAFLGEHQSAIYRRSLFDMGARNGTSRKDEDTTFLLSACLLSEDIVLEESAVYRYVMREGSLVHTYQIDTYMAELDSIAEKAALLATRASDEHAQLYLDGKVAIRLTNLYDGIRRNPPIAGSVGEYAVKLADIVDHAPALAFLKGESTLYGALVEHHAALPHVGYLPNDLKVEGARSWLDFIRRTPCAGLPYLKTCVQAQEVALRHVERTQGRDGFELAYQQTLDQARKLPLTTRSVFLVALRRKFESGHGVWKLLAKL